MSKPDFTGLFFYRVRQQGSFEVLLVFCLHFALWKLEIPNFDPLYSKLGELNIQNSLPWVTHNMPGTCWLIFIGFYHIDFRAEYEGCGLSYPLVRPCTACCSLPGDIGPSLALHWRYMWDLPDPRNDKTRKSSCKMNLEKDFRPCSHWAWKAISS